MKPDILAYIHNKKATLALDRERWLGIIEMFYDTYKETTDPVTKEFCKNQMKFCGEQSQEIKKLIATLK